jgi:hypothetical protein
MEASTQMFLRDVRCPVSRSNLITTLAAGNVMQVDRLPVELLPAVVLLATVGLRSHNQQIVDNYAELLASMESTFKNRELTHKDYAHVSMMLVSTIVNEGPRGEYHLDENPEAEYIFEAYAELMNNDVDTLFAVPEKRRK